MAGLERADTVTIDGHKQMLMPIGTGMVFFRDPEFSRCLVHTAPYAVRKTSLDQGRFTFEGTRPANMLYLHACFHLIGKQGYNELFSLALNNIKTMATFNYQLKKTQGSRGRSFVSRSVRKFSQYGDEELVFLRVVVLNPCVNKDHILFMLQDQLEIALDLEQKLSFL